MSEETVFARSEQKYLLTRAQYEALLGVLAARAHPDAYSLYTVLSIYYDTADFAMLRAAMDHPYYREKLRLRSYGVPGPADTAFVEVKKKCGGIVYKRREAMPLREAECYLAARQLLRPRTQILSEIDVLLARAPVEPKVMIAYDRRAFAANEDEALRITFDTGLRWRDTDLALAAGDRGTPLAGAPQALLELKLHNAMPLWLAHTLSQIGAVPTSFSKVGTWYAARRRAAFQPILSAKKGVLTCA